MRTIIESVAATGGFLENCRITLFPGLNCLIGARGTCKSTFVESVRFAFEADSQRVEQMIKATLGGGSIRCGLRDLGEPEATLYSVEREHGSPRRIYREGVKDLTDAGDLERIEIYSQSDLQRIADDDTGKMRLALIDRLNLREIRTLRRQQTEIAERLSTLGRQLREARSRGEQLRLQTRELPSWRQQLSELQKSRPSFSSELDRERGFYQNRQTLLRAVEAGLAERDLIVEHLNQCRAQLAAVQSIRQQIETLNLPEGQESVHVFERVATILQGVLNESDALRQVPVPNFATQLHQTVDDLSRTYYDLRQEEQEANESLKKEDFLKQNIEHLARCEKELSDTEEQCEMLYEERRNLRQEFKRIGEQVTRLRLEEVDAINAHHASTVLLSLEPGAQSAEYTQHLYNLLQGSRLHGQKEIAQELSQTLLPSELVDLVESGNTQEMAAILNRDVLQVTRLMSYLIDTLALYDLEGHIFEDALAITLYDDGQPKPVEDLSKGQKATALLPLILRSADYPLIFDQPEDDLDNSFIFKALVQAVLTLKQERQLIFVTHNANIPVIGEAENVVVMQMETPERAAPTLQGTVDERKEEIVDLLEGGANAFVERQKLYQGLLER